MEGSSERGRMRADTCPRAIAIDTGLAEGSVAAVEGERTAVVRFSPAQAHARRIGAALVEAARALGFDVADADVIAVVRGPGSFTGLRVGIAAAKGIAWASGIPLVGVSAHVAVAGAVGPSAPPVHVAFDAGRGDVSAALVVPDRSSPCGWTIDSERLLAAGEWIAGLPAGATVSGPALDEPALAGPLAARDDLVLVPPELRRPCAVRVARLGAALAAAGRTDDPAALLPDYSRPSYVQENLPRPSR